MSTRRLTIELPEESYEILQRNIEAGEFSSKEEAISRYVTGLLLDEFSVPGNPDHERWLREEVAAAEEEAEAHPETLLSGDEVLDFLKSQRERRNKASNAA